MPPLLQWPLQLLPSSDEAGKSRWRNTPKLRVNHESTLQELLVSQGTCLKEERISVFDLVCVSLDRIQLRKSLESKRDNKVSLK